MSSASSQAQADPAGPEGGGGAVPQRPPPGGPYPCNYLVLSDLHLTLALDHEEREADQALVTFFDHYRAHRVDGRPWRLIFAGDTFDLLFPDTLLFHERHPGPDAPPMERAGYLERREVPAMAWRLRQTLREHAPMWEALGRFLLAGNHVVFIKGNHDVELQWALLQRTLVAGLVETLLEAGCAASEEQLGACVGFRDWFYLDRGRLYVEHGNQYDEFNCWPNFLDPALVHDAQRAFMPLGSRMTQYLTNAFVDYRPGPARGTFMHYIVRNGKLLSGVFLGRSLRVVAHALGNAGAFSEEAWRSSGGHEDHALQLVNERSGVPVESLQRLQAMQATPATAIRGFFFNRMFLDRLFVAGFCSLLLGLALFVGALSPNEPALHAALLAAPFAALAALVARVRRHAWASVLKWVLPALLVGCCVAAPLVLGEGSALGTATVAMACLAISVAMGMMPMAEMIELKVHLRQRAEQIEQVLGVRTVIFGHHHRVDEHPLPGGGLYLNCGTWVNAGVETTHSHVVLVHDADGGLRPTLYRGREYLDTPPHTGA